MLKKLFTNDKFFLIVTILAIFGEGLYAIIGLIAGSTMMPYLQMLIRVLCVVVLYYSYKKHSKNVMKGMIGALLMAQLLNSVSYITERSEYYRGVFIIFFVLSALMFVNHFIINSEHHSNPTMVLMNQLIAIGLVAINTYTDMFMIFHTTKTLAFVLGLIDVLGFVGMVAVIVCVESRLDVYRLDREAAGWTEESGYPEGYVHQKDR